MKIEAKVFIWILSLLFLTLSSTPMALAQANVSRSPNWSSTSPRIDIDSAGNLHVVWAEYYSGDSGDAFYSKYDRSTQTWSTPFNVSNSSRVHTHENRAVGLCIDSSDKIYVIYVEGPQVTMRINSGGNWEAPYVIDSWGSGDADCPRIAVDDNGNIFTCWWKSDAWIVFSKARVGGTWESTKQISTGAGKFPDIAVGHNEAFCVWTQRYNVYQVVYTRRGKGFNASWSSPQIIYGSSVKQQVPCVEIDSNNVAHAVFTPAYEDITREVWYSYWTGNGWAPVQNIAQRILLHYPSLAEKGNNLFATWQVGAYGNGSSINYNTKIGGNWTGEMVTPSSQGSTYCDITGTPAGDEVYIVWDAYGEIWCNMGETGPPPPPPPPPSGNPVASFVFSPTSGSAPLTVTFDASASYDPDGSIVSYAWNFGDGGTGSGRVTSHTYTTMGTFTITLTVTDNEGKRGSTSRSLTILKVNEPPIAEFSFSPTTGIFPLSVTFDASASRDPDGSIVYYGWDFGDGRTATGRVVTHTYNTWGNFSVRLTIRDNNGATATKIRSIEVLRLLQPLNIRWQTHVDESLFQTRYVNEVKWDRNPQNDDLGAKLGFQIVLYRVWRKKTAEPYSLFIPIAEISGDNNTYLDKKAGGKDVYTYTVTSVDNHGRESPIVEGAATQQTGTKLNQNPPRLRGLIQKK